MQQAAVFIKSEMGKIRHSDNIETKALNSLVTYVDKESEKIVTELQKIILGPLFNRRKYDAKTQGEWQWIIDPLDGTTNFIHQGRRICNFGWIKTPR